MVGLSEERLSTPSQFAIWQETKRLYPPFELNDLLTLNSCDGTVCVRLIYSCKYAFALGRVVSMEGETGDIRIGEIVVVSADQELARQ
jgi:hypothetical protein